MPRKRGRRNLKESRQDLPNGQEAPNDEEISTKSAQLTRDTLYTFDEVVDVWLDLKDYINEQMLPWLDQKSAFNGLYRLVS